MVRFAFILFFALFCAYKKVQVDSPKAIPDYVLSTENTHNRFSQSIPPVLTVPSGSVIEAHTKEASDGQLSSASTVEDLATLDFDPIHPLTGPVYVEGAQVGDVLAVTLHEIELGAYGRSEIVPGFGFLADEFPDPALYTYTFHDGQTHVTLPSGAHVTLNPSLGVMGVAPATDSLLSTIPPRANGGNMDDPHMVEGTTVYFPVLVEDAHAVQGLGEACGTAIEISMRIVYEINILCTKSTS